MIPALLRAPSSFSSLALALLLCCAAPLARGGDWSNQGGNAGRNGQGDATAPYAADLIWSGGRSSIIAWHPVIEGKRVIQVRQTGFPPGGEPNGSPVVCQDLDTGAELWAKNIPFNTGDWTTWVGGVNGGRVYASRAGNGGSIAAKLYALDVTNGNTVWTSTDSIKTGAYDGIVFAQDGDIIVAWHQQVMRIRATDGTTAWATPRIGSVSGNCGACVHGNAVYVADAAPGGHVIKRFDLTTGAFQYQSPVMPGFTLQNSPMVGPDGSIYLSRTQNNAAVDFFYSFADSGAAITENWHVPAGWSTSTELAVGPDGSVYMLAPGFVVLRLDPVTGGTLNTSAAITTAASTAPHIAVDVEGKVYVSNGGFPEGRVWAMNADLTPRWSVAVANINIGGPALADDGTLVVSGIGTNIRAYRSPNRFSDRRHALAGTFGPPTLTGKGSLLAGDPVTLTVANTLPGNAVTMIIGASEVNLPLLGGTLVPAATIVLPGLIADGTGRLELGGNWPAGVPAMTSIYFQGWMPDAGGVQGAAASNGLKATSP